MNALLTDQDLLVTRSYFANLNILNKLRIKKIEQDTQQFENEYFKEMNNAKFKNHTHIEKYNIQEMNFIGHMNLHTGDFKKELKRFEFVGRVSCKL